LKLGKGLKMDALLYSLIAACRTARLNWQHEDEIFVYEPGRGRSVPPPPVQLACDAFVDANDAMEKATPRTQAGWLAKWAQIVEYETEFDYGDADYNLKMMQQMMAEYAGLALRQQQPFELASAIC
jgi:hypothetical protein